MLADRNHPRVHGRCRRDYSNLVQVVLRTTSTRVGSPQDYLHFVQVVLVGLHTLDIFPCMGGLYTRADGLLSLSGLQTLFIVHVVLVYIYTTIAIFRPRNRHPNIYIAQSRIWQLHLVAQWQSSRHMNAKVAGSNPSRGDVFVLYNCYSCISISLKNRIKRGERQSPVAAIDTWKISPSCKRKLYVFCSAFHQKLTQTHNSNQSVIPFTSYVLKGMKTRCPVVKFTCFCHHGTAFSSQNARFK